MSHVEGRKGPYPTTHFRALCREASQGGPDNSYESVGRALAGEAHKLLVEMYDDEDVRGEKIDELSSLIWGKPPVTRVRSWEGFSVSDDSGKVIAWFKREFPLYMNQVPNERSETFLRGVYRYVVEEENDITQL
jgi:hypothetical protein